MKKGKKERRELNGKIIAVIGIIIVFIMGLFMINTSDESNTNGNLENAQVNNAGGNVKTVNYAEPSLSEEQMNILTQSISSSEFIKDLPEKGVIGLKFYDFSGDKRIWRKTILIGREGILTSGKPDFVLFMHSRYISELNENNLCEVIKSAQANGEMWTESQESDARLLLKYSGMMKYRDCFGF